MAFLEEVAALVEAAPQEVGNMNITRIIKHIGTSRRQVRALFSQGDLEEIKQRIAASEKQHSGEVVFFVEGRLPILKLLRGQSSKNRALEIFSLMRVWDTEHNNGVMIYLLVADRKFEIIADRGLDKVVTAAGWEQVKTKLEESFRQRKFKQGILEALNSITTYLKEAFPHTADDKNEVGDDVRFV